MVKLKEQLQEMVDQADKDPGEPVQRLLGGGLHVVIVNDRSAYELTLARKGVGPSDQEMKTVLNCWPYDPVPLPAVSDGLFRQMLALHCRVPRKLV